MSIELQWHIIAGNAFRETYKDIQAAASITCPRLSKTSRVATTLGLSDLHSACMVAMNAFASDEARRFQDRMLSGIVGCNQSHGASRNNHRICKDFLHFSTTIVS